MFLKLRSNFFRLMGACGGTPCLGGDNNAAGLGWGGKERGAV
ncbi:hypothetical protein TREPR_2021 [Treponema primitia ZAS-2]|uniref:Uncharacterized protein n=1 Tax=Treponema primitia (strain ATCC BAA-887 / DSM 12427 / ZAS-2) TaxID=545694 RepID=F5YJW0_TREPZ|nr:hypothetical protein TREPR_2021 [Treponema primitia ZAS-2]